MTGGGCADRFRWISEGRFSRNGPETRPMLGFRNLTVGTTVKAGGAAPLSIRSNGLQLPLTIERGRGRRPPAGGCHGAPDRGIMRMLPITAPRPEPKCPIARCHVVEFAGNFRSSDSAEPRGRRRDGSSSARSVPDCRKSRAATSGCVCSSSVSSKASRCGSSPTATRGASRSRCASATRRLRCDASKPTTCWSCLRPEAERSHDRSGLLGTSHRAAGQSQLRQDRAVQPADREPAEGRELRRRHRRAQGRPVRHADGATRPGARSAGRLQPEPAEPGRDHHARRRPRRQGGRAAPGPAGVRDRCDQPAPESAPGRRSQAAGAADGAGAQHGRRGKAARDRDRRPGARKGARHAGRADRRRAARRRRRPRAPDPAAPVRPTDARARVEGAGCRRRGRRTARSPAHSRRRGA